MSHEASERESETCEYRPRHNHTTRNESGDRPPCDAGLSPVKVTMASAAHSAVVLSADEVCWKMIMLMGASMTLGACGGARRRRG